MDVDLIEPSLSEMRQQDLLEKAIAYFIDHGKNITGVFDLLLRGNSLDDLIPEWSDLDLSIIVEELNPSICDEVRKLYQMVKMIFPSKVSIAIISKADFFARCHHHGIKPLYYAPIAKRRKSLLRKCIYSHDSLGSTLLQVDCTANLAYLIHDLRSRYLTREHGSVEFCLHLLKRTRHIIRNSLYILEGVTQEEIDPKLFAKRFPNIECRFLDRWKETRATWSFIIKDKSAIEATILDTYALAERIYEEMIPTLEKVVESNLSCKWEQS